jgi:serine/threonine protein kinase
MIKKNKTILVIIMFVTTMAATAFSYSSQPLENEAAIIAKKYKIADDKDFCLRVAKACRFIRESKIDLIEQFPINKTIFKISKTNPDEFSIYLGRDRAGNIHFFINLGKKISFKNEGHHKVLSHVIKFDDESIEKWVLAKMPLKDDLKKMMAKNESQFLCMFPDKEELMQTDLFEILPTKGADKQYIFMPFYELGSLEQALINNYVFSNEERLQLFLDIANAVVSMHKNNVAYRDIKPENILLYKKDNQLRAKLTDFGLSNELREDAIFKLNASPYVFSPELLELRAANKTEIDREDIKPCDIWALGLTFYRMFFCVKPYEEAYKASRQIKDHHKFKLAIEEWLETNFPEPTNKFSIQHLIYEMLSIDPQKRPNIEQVVERLII